MYKKLTITLFAAIISLPVLASDDVTEARALIKQFGSTLKGQLVGAMKEGGPVKALKFCNVRAPGIASDTAASSGWEVGRTSLKIRSKENAPDAWELGVLEQFESKKASGADPAKLDFSEVVESNGKKTFRYMKAIPTEKACLKCHAAKVSPEVEAELKALYPDDKARGFKEGDIRGAFSLSKPL
ncbi:MAG: DUF3365 domain-containing protein [Sedimenticola sp.]|nr:DUF3365 domain-containing protein [Sedimenticola sp.]MCW9021815.1 DUF3365 domain-containing protein [Sedimenticola sp.]